MFAWLRWRIAHLRWWMGTGYRASDPLYGTGETRRANLKIMRERHWAAEPKLEDFK